MIDREVWLITGATGLLGANAADLLSKNKKIIGLARKAPSSSGIEFIQTDLTSPHAREGLIERLKPDVVLNCAAVASIESCEARPDIAKSLNVDAAVDLARQAASLHVPFIHISTDAVHDGKSGNYLEDDEATPTTVYGQTKLESELEVLNEHPDALVARVNFYGLSPSGSRSLAEYFINNLKARRPTPGFTDVRVSTMYVGTLVDRLERLISAEESGLFNVVNDEAISKFEFGRAIAKRFGFDEELVNPARSTDILSVSRGADLSLNTGKLKRALNLASTQASDIEALFEDWISGRAKKISTFATNV